jgi:integrase/recombinase XerC/integrase/recombinase XerD
MDGTTLGTVTLLHAECQAQTLAPAIGSYLGSIDRPESRRTRDQYAATLRRLARRLGRGAELSAVDDATVTAWVEETWGGRRPATYNRAIDALRAAWRYWVAQSWATADPTAGLHRRKIAPDRSRALSRADVSQLLTRDGAALRDRTLRRTAYESAARVGELLAPDVDDLDLANRRARVVRKGGAADVIVWQSGTARLLPRLIRGRTAGPLFLADRRARVQLAAADLDSATGRARPATARPPACSQPGGPWTLHQLHHSALTHAARTGHPPPLSWRTAATPRSGRSPGTHGSRPSPWPAGRDNGIPCDGGETPRVPVPYEIPLAGPGPRAGRSVAGQFPGPLPGGLAGTPPGRRPPARTAPALFLSKRSSPYHCQAKFRG